jgi:hypothetical protein
MLLTLAGVETSFRPDRQQRGAGSTSENGWPSAQSDNEARRTCDSLTQFEYFLAVHFDPDLIVAGGSFDRLGAGGYLRFRHPIY